MSEALSRLMHLPGRLLERLLSSGERPGEPSMRRARRRAFIVLLLLALLGQSISVLQRTAAEQYWVAVPNMGLILVLLVALFAIRRFPHAFTVLVHGILAFAVVLGVCAETVLLGGLYGSGLSAVWGFVLTLGAVVTLGTRAAVAWFAIFVAMVIFSVLTPLWIAPLYHAVDPSSDAAVNLIGAGVVVFAILAHFVRQRDRYQRESDELLLNMLPAPIAARLKNSHEMIAEEFDGVSVLFADIVNFTQLSSRMSPETLVGLLNEVFSRFDAFVGELGLEKIKTIGDAYMAAAGVPARRADHAIVIAELALRIQETLAREQFHGHHLAMRIGINSGPVVAGIIGRHKFAYDLWGDAVNTASRMESVGISGAIQITEATHDLIRHAYRCEPRGEIAVKGKGSMPAYLLLGRLPSATPAASPVAGERAASTG